jgi:3-hydroxybutyryl-CoA dehydrogenase
MKEIKTVGIVGFGVMGAAIGLNAAAAGYQVIYKELNDDLVKSMYAKWVESPLKSRLEKGKLTQDEMDRMTSRIRGTSRYSDLAACDLVIEAAVENMDLKIQIFSELSRVCPEETLIASNTSTFLIEKLMQKVSSPQRTAGLHYFFPANVNRLVEVIRQKATSEATYRSLMAFAEKNRKIAISVKDFPGFAINPIFIASYMVLDSFLGQTYNVATLEDISQKALGVRFGIMWVQNGSGMGTCYHAAVSMNNYLAQTDVGYPMLPAQLKDQFESGEPWNLTDGPVLDDSAARAAVQDRLLGAIFAISSHLIEKQVVSVKDLELGVCTALAWPKGPFGLMNELGVEESRRLVNLAVEAGYFKMPARFAARQVTPWQI